MNITFLGGANEVGASCTLIEINEQRILVDAGIRQNVELDKQLPGLDLLDKLGMPDAFLLTHAHTDHTGALPALVSRLPADVKGYCTPATQVITRVLLEDSRDRADCDKQEGKQPLFTPEAIDKALDYLGFMETVQWNTRVEICDGAKATWIPAGHILGAAMIFIEGGQERILMTGDVSVTGQKTIPGMSMSELNLPHRPDVMVMESTYGNRQHTDRAAEERRLVSDIAEVIEAGGKALIPVFAIGRSQEVILILKHAMESGQIPEFPVWVDGMVRKVNGIYSRFSDELAPNLQRRSQPGDGIFYSDSIGPIRAVSSRDPRDMILSASQPCCIVASSGMLNGGASNEYAMALANNRKNLIAITGYQAKGTPGQALVDEKDPAKRVLALDGKPPLPAPCGVERYNLSAHADKDQLTELGRKVNPRRLFLVHGDDSQSARESLAESIQEACPRVEVTLPRNGKTYAVRHYTGIVGEQSLPLDMMLPKVLDFAARNGLKGPFCAHELAEIYYGTEATNPSKVASFLLCLWLKLGRPVKETETFYPKDLIKC